MALILTCVAAVACLLPAFQKDSLLTFFNATSGNNWLNSYGLWSGATEPCSVPWFGVGCDPYNENIVSVSLDSNNLNGSLPNLLLPKLTTL